MRYWFFIFLIGLLALNSCEKGCYRCQSSTICTIGIKGTDTISRCFQAAGAADSMKKYTAMGYKCADNSGVQYEIKSCQQDSLVAELQREGYSCGREN
jgi:hypothetical protein